MNAITEHLYGGYRQKLINVMLIAFLAMTFLLSVESGSEIEILRADNARIKAKIDSLYIECLAVRTEKNLYEVVYR